MWISRVWQGNEFTKRDTTKEKEWETVDSNKQKKRERRINRQITQVWITSFLSEPMCSGEWPLPRGIHSVYL